jgi:SAM-dependent methyltransferase
MSAALDPRLAAILACPRCGSSLQHLASSIQCGKCSSDFRIEQGVPIFIAEEVEIAREHTSNAIGGEFEQVLREGREFVLNIGAGGTAVRYPNCVEFERKIFRHTDVVGDAHHLPFSSGVFDRVFAFNVFEHLREPRKAAGEIHRVLKPGGSIAIHTAFLQPLHEAPFHFYNATEFGVRAWFEQFDIERCGVSGNFTAPFMLGFLLANLLTSVAASCGDAARREIGATTLEQWATFWDNHDSWPAGLQTLQNLPNEIQARVAGGFELIARKP